MVSQASRLIERLYRVRRGELLIGGVPVTDLARSYGTPLFVYDGRVVESAWSRLRRRLIACSRVGRSGIR